MCRAGFLYLECGYVVGVRGAVTWEGVRARVEVTVSFRIGLGSRSMRGVRSMCMECRFINVIRGVLGSGWRILRSFRFRSHSCQG